MYAIRSYYEITSESTGADIAGLTPGNTYNCRLIVTGGSRNGISNSYNFV